MLNTLRPLPGPERIRFPPPKEVIRAQATASPEAANPRISTHRQPPRPRRRGRPFPAARAQPGAPVPARRRTARGPRAGREPGAGQSRRELRCSRDVAFSSCAVPTITGALKRHYRDHGWSVRVPRELQELAMRIQRFGEAASAATGNPVRAAARRCRASASRRSSRRARRTRRCMPTHSTSLGSHVDDDGRCVAVRHDRYPLHTAFRSAFDRVPHRLSAARRRSTRATSQSCAPTTLRSSPSRRSAGRPLMVVDVHLAAAPARHRETGRQRTLRSLSWRGA